MTGAAGRYPAAQGASTPGRAKIAASRRRGWSSLIPVAVFAAGILILLSPSLLGGKILSSGDVVFFQGPFNGAKPTTLTRMGNSELFDPVLEFQPDLIAIRRALESGELGLWAPDQSAGRPMWASQQTAPLFPLTWLAFVGSFWRALAWIAALKMLLAAMGAFLLARWSGLSRGPATLTGVSYAFCTYLNNGLQFPLSTVLAMTPWAMLMAGRVGRMGRAADALGLILAIGLMFTTGSPELIAIALGGVSAYALFELFANVAAPDGAPLPGRWRRFGLLAVGAVGGTALAGAVLAPFAEFLSLANTTSRGGEAYPNNIAYAFFFPELWGRPDKAIGQFGPINYTERTAYLGALPLLLAVGGVVARRPNRVHGFWVVFTAIAVMIAMDTFVHEFVAGLPGPNHVNMLRTLMLVELGGALCAGLGLQAWLSATSSGRRRMMVVMIAAALLPVAFLLRSSDPFSHFFGALGQLPSLGREAVSEKSFIKQIVAWHWLVFGGVGLVLLALSRRLGSRVIVVALIALVACDLLSMDAGYDPQIPLSEATPPTPEAVGYVQSHVGHQRVSETLDATSVDLQANLGERYALRDLGSYNFPKTNRWALLWGAYGQSTGDQNDWSSELPKSHAVLDAFAVKYVLPPAGIPLPAGLKSVFEQSSGSQLVLENPTALPRAWIAYDWRAVSNQTQATNMTVNSTTPQLEGQPVLEDVQQGGDAAASSHPAPATFLADRDEFVSLRVNAERSGYVLLDDSYYPGWRATVDGHDARIVAANQNFRAVAVGPGVHVVDFRYRPTSFKIGAILTIATALGLVLAAAGLLLRRRRTRTAPL
jgi:hypothetical protein